MLRLTRAHPRLWGWTTAILSVILPVASIVCWLHWHDMLLAWLLVAPLVFVWPGCTIRMLQQAVAEREEHACPTEHETSDMDTGHW
ncbi:hypothetical protein [Bifidobacterium animalis]|uniref:hypothetical protein n=1 Tax=Bifidobacterium animalis TaxID=28025 RepID=UPI000B1D4B94|nr:hypothetical protein [Bifidobacterium animalis]